MTQEEKNKLIELRNYFMQRTDYFSAHARINTASSQGSQSQGSYMYKGVAKGYIGARSKLEELFDYLNLWE